MQTCIPTNYRLLTPTTYRCATEFSWKPRIKKQPIWSHAIYCWPADATNVHCEQIMKLWVMDSFSAQFGESADAFRKLRFPITTISSSLAINYITMYGMLYNIRTSFMVVPHWLWALLSTGRHRLIAVQSYLVALEWTTKVNSREFVEQPRRQTIAAIVDWYCIIIRDHV